MTSNKNQGGRPRLDSADLRIHVVKTTLTDREYEKFKHDSLKSGMTPSRYLRKLISGAEIKEALSHEERTAQKGLYKIGQLMAIFYKNTPFRDQQAYSREYKKCVDGLNEIIDYFNQKVL